MPYAGYVPEGQRSLEVEQEADLDNKSFWAAHIAARKPVVIQGHPSDGGWKASALWSDAYLKANAGNANLKVEVRSGPQASFGTGGKAKVDMKFSQFLDRLAASDDTVYLTTQEVPLADDMHPALVGEPLCRLTSDFVTVPELFGALVPQQLNLWMGCALPGCPSSSGLHHDFHDNLYVLLRGVKHFRLWAPSEAVRMHTHGKIKQIHANGRIVYEGQGDVLPDGSSARDVAAWKARHAAETRLAAAEAAESSGQAGAMEEKVAAEAALDEVLDEQMEEALDLVFAQGGGGPGEEDDDLNSLQDDYVDSEEDLSDSDEEASKGDNEQEHDEELHQGRRGLGDAAHRAKAGAPKGKVKGTGAKAAPETVQEDDPPSFCTGVDLSLPDDVIRHRFPRFPGRSSALEVTLVAGQMLYLPAGWFHEVRSENKPGGTSHAAFNYWFHPPDNLDPSPAGFHKPYLGDYWPSLWSSRCAGGVYPPSLTPQPESRSRTNGHVHFEGAQSGPGHVHFGGAQADPPTAASPTHRRQSFEGVHVDELDGATGHDPHRGKNHTFNGVHVDELDGGTGHVPHPESQPSHQQCDDKHHSFEGVHVDELEGGTGHVPHPEAAVAVSLEALVAQAWGGDEGAGGRRSRKGGAPKRKGGDAVAQALEQGQLPPAKEVIQVLLQETSGLKKRVAQLEHEVAHTSPTSASKERSTGGKKGRVPAAVPAAGDKKGKVPAPAATAGGKKRKAPAQAEEDDALESGEAPSGLEEDQVALLDGEEGELGEMVAKEVGEYFQSEEGAGAWKKALGSFLLEALKKGGLSDLIGDEPPAPKPRRKRRGRRHHRCVYIPLPENLSHDDGEDEGKQKTKRAA